MTNPPATGVPWSGTVMRGGHAPFDPDMIDPDRGAFFTTDPMYAAAFGDVVHRFAVTLRNPLVHDERGSEGTIEIDRRILISQGWDGRAIVYDDGEWDIVALHPHQIEDLGPVGHAGDGQRSPLP